LSTATENVGRGERSASGPEDLSKRDWIASFKRAGKSFMKDDCMGLAQQVAYSSLLRSSLRRCCSSAFSA